MALDVLIIGSGFSGLGMAIALQKEGKRKYLLLEKAASLGGTWRENRYPGCACDVPSHLYSFSFAPNADWSHHFAPQEEILAYLQRVAEQHGVLSQCRFNAEVVECRFDERPNLWRVSTRAGETFEARHVVLGIGGLHHPKKPELPGTFGGVQLHSAQWDPTVPLEGKRVAIVGTGASAIQLVPALAARVKELFVFQRTPAWVMPRHDAPISRFTRWLFKVAPWLMALRRAGIYLRLESRAVGFTRAPWLLRAGEWLGKRHIRKQVRDVRVQEALTPRYAAGCKRVLLSDDYYPAFNRPNVTLISGAVQSLTERGVVGADGREVEVDVIAWCTGFEVTAPLKNLRVFGRGGLELSAFWGEGLRAYRGTTMPGFPNLFMLTGPNTGLGHNSMVFMIESQLAFVMEHLKALDAAGKQVFEVRPEAERAFNADLERRLPGTVWASGCSSWYLDERGKNTTLWPGSTLEFRRLTAKVELLDVELR